MINELINFTDALFPSISPYTRDNVRKAIKQFYDEGKQLNCFLSTPLEYLAQGDIVSELPFIFFDENGEEFSLKTDGIILSNTCDCERDNNILIAPFIDFSNIDKDIQSLKGNTSYGYLYFPDNTYENFVVDFTMTTSFSRKLISNKFQKISSLNGYGYYLFLIKLTVYLMRPEDAGVKEYRNINLEH